MRGEWTSSILINWVFLLRCKAVRSCKHSSHCWMETAQMTSCHPCGIAQCWFRDKKSKDLLPGTTSIQIGWQVLLESMSNYCNFKYPANRPIESFGNNTTYIRQAPAGCLFICLVLWLLRSRACHCDSTSSISLLLWSSVVAFGWGTGSSGWLAGQSHVQRNGITQGTS